jgi:hypothetical protein
VGTLADGTPFLAEAGMEDDKRKDRNLAKAEAARFLETERLVLRQMKREDACQSVCFVCKSQH